MRLKVDVSEKLRAILNVDGVPSEFLGPGRYRLWKIGKNLDVTWFNTGVLIAELSDAQRAVVPASEFIVVDLLPSQRAVVSCRGRPRLWLAEGETVLWKTDKSMRVDVIDTSAIVAKPLAKNVERIAAIEDYVEVTVPNGCVAVRTVDGQLDEVLGPGRHAAWKTVREVNFAILDMRERVLDVVGQELMTKDRVSVRINASVVFQIDAPKVLATVARDADSLLYLAVQLALREAVSQRTLDEVLKTRNIVAEEIEAEVKARASKVGLKVDRLGVKDLILPGEMKALMNRVIEASKQAEASVILRREEIAATRALAQTAKLLEAQPALMRLKELESYKELAERVGSVNLVLGEQSLKAIELTKGL